MQRVNICSVNISEHIGTVKKPVSVIELLEQGIRGDAHAGPWNRQVSLLGMESIRKFSAEASRDFKPGEFAENITTEGLTLWNLHPLDRLVCGEVELEITQIGKECHGSGCSIFQEVGNCVMPKEGIFARVIRPGILKAGDWFDYQPKVFHVQVITLSDRASFGVYEDKSGLRLQERVRDFFRQLEMSCTIHYSLIPDDRQKLEEILIHARKEAIDLIFTTGGTGISPKDITPDVVKTILDKEIPGIMEMIRIKYGSEKPQALVSRSISGVMGTSLIFTLPGSVKAVNEYLDEIFRSLIHLIYMLHGLDSH
jgi:molybdenum cofactor synthesis domain-containing protein